MPEDEDFENFDLSEVRFTPELLSCIPANIARRFRVLPVRNYPPGSLTVALDDPSDLNVIDAVKIITQLDVTLCIVDSQQLDEFIQRLYGDQQV
jgi:hypothetical protein